MKEILMALSRGEHLHEHVAEDVMHQMMSGAVSPAQIAAYLTLLKCKGETIAELTGSVRAMREHAVTLAADVEGLIDTCGTGGDHSGTFNISTAAAFVAAAGGVNVAKHGNRAASSQTGSADVLTALGITIDLAPEAARKCLEQTGFCFLFAQAYHPAMKYVAPVRKELGFRTMFNFLGPLTNPARPKRQVLGTPALDVAHKMASVLSALGCEHAFVVHAADGLDEISIAAPTHVFEVYGDRIEEYDIHPGDFGICTQPLDGIRGGSPQENAAIIHSIFRGERSSRRDVVVINAAAALYVAGKARTLMDGARLAEGLIDDGVALKKLREVTQYSKRLAEGVSV